MHGVARIENYIISSVCSFVFYGYHSSDGIC